MYHIKFKEWLQHCSQHSAGIQTVEIKFCINYTYVLMYPGTWPIIVYDKAKSLPWHGFWTAVDTFTACRFELKIKNHIFAVL